MKYLLDTNAVIDIVGDPAGETAQRLRTTPPPDVGVSAVVMHELYFGAYKSVRIAHNVAIVDALQFDVLEFDREDAQAAGEIRAHLVRAGQAIGPFDVLIAGQARARGLILVTNNRREFDRVPGLVVEDWRAGVL
jgi:tRNA(fMet)-specific endonuclease VapC